MQRIEVLLAVRASVAIVEMLPKGARVVAPVLADAVVTALADGPAIGLAAVLQQSVPAVRIDAAFGTVPVTARVAQVTSEAVF